MIGPARFSALCLFAVASCAPSNTGAPPTKAALVQGGGKILSLRPVTQQPDTQVWRAALLAHAAASDGASAGLVEFIIRTDDGGTISVVQANDAGFRAGDRVTILRGGQTRLAPAS